MQTSFNFTIEALALTLIIKIKLIEWTRSADSPNIFSYEIRGLHGELYSIHDPFVFEDPEVADELYTAIEKQIEQAVKGRHGQSSTLQAVRFHPSSGSERIDAWAQMIDDSRGFLAADYYRRNFNY